LIFILASKMFSSTTVGITSVILFLFNGSLSFLDFLKNYPLSPQSLSRLVNLSDFVSFGPWNGSLITAFWNLNIYTNQRHLGLSFAVCLLIVYILFTRSEKLLPLTGFLLGSLLLTNQAAFAVGVLFTGWFFLVRPPLRLPLIASSIGLIPWLILARYTMNISPSVIFKPGYLVSGSLTPVSFLRFWFYNLGLNSLFIPVGFLLAPKKARIFAVPLTVLFILPNLWQFSPDMINNHKLFNFFLIIGVMFSANVLIKASRVKHFGFVLALILTLGLTLGGIVDFFPVKNDYFVRINDIAADPDAAFFAGTPKTSTVLNSFWFYHPASIAGRSIYNGYPYFTWSYGYNQVARENSAVGIYRAETVSEACSLLKSAGISYVELSPFAEKFINPNWQLWQTGFIPVYKNPKTGLSVFSVIQNCPGS
jgi:hypothetical protein